MLPDAAIVADFETGRVHEADAATRPKAGAQVGTQWQQGTGHPLDKAPVADQARKRLLPVCLHLVVIVGFEIAGA
jgi:hypothetical protein